MILIRNMKILLTSFLTLALLLGCGGTKKDADGTPVNKDKEKLIEVLTLFVEAVQGDRFDLAFTFLSPTESAKMVEANGQPSMLTQRRLKAVRLSTLAQKSGVELNKGKLQGIYEWLPVISESAPEKPQDLDAPVVQ